MGVLPKTSWVLELVLFVWGLLFLLTREVERVIILCLSLLICEEGIPLTCAAVSKSVSEYPWACALSQKACICSSEIWSILIYANCSILRFCAESFVRIPMLKISIKSIFFVIINRFFNRVQI